MRELIEMDVPEIFELDGLEIISTIVSPNNEKTGILLVGENFDLLRPYNPLVRVYLLNLNEKRYEVKKELYSFSFETTEKASEFLSKLPNLTVIDLILMLNNEELAFAN